MQVCRDFWHRGKCYLDGPESSLEYWKQEREKSQWETVLVRLKPQHKHKQAFIHPHTHQDRKLPNYFQISDTVQHPEPLWLTKITHKIEKNLRMRAGLLSSQGWSRKVAVNMSQSAPEEQVSISTWASLTKNAHLRDISFLKLCSLSPCASQFSASLMVSSPNRSWLSPVTMT